MKKYSELQYPSLQTIIATFCDPDSGQDDVDIGLTFTKEYVVNYPAEFNAVLDQLKKAELDPNLNLEEVNSGIRKFKNSDEARSWFQKIRKILEISLELIQKEKER